jgi:hypothetical protein
MRILRDCRRKQRNNHLCRDDFGAELRGACSAGLNHLTPALAAQIFQAAVTDAKPPNPRERNEPEDPLTMKGKERPHAEP